MNSISKKKPTYQVNEEFMIYLEEFGRLMEIPFNYTDLLRFSSSIPLRDKAGKDTLCECVFYSPA